MIRALAHERRELETRAAPELDVEEDEIVVVAREQLAGLRQQTRLADDVDLRVNRKQLPQRGARRGFVVNQHGRANGVSP